MSILYNEVAVFAETTPEKISIVDSDGSFWTYQDLIRCIDDTANLLLYFSGFHQFKSVAISSAETFHSVGLIFAVAKLELRAVTLSKSLRINQVKDILVESATSWLISDIQNLGNGFLEIARLEDFFLYKLDPTEFAGSDLVESDFPGFLVTSSSGSTGNPKPIVFSQELKSLRAAQSRDLYRVTPHDIILNASPFSHSLGQRLTFLPLLNGATLVQLPKFSPSNWISAVRKHNVSFTICVSSHLHGLTSFLLAEDFDLASLRCLVSSSASLNYKIKSDLFLSENFEFHEQYGTSEVATVTNASKSEFQLAPNSVGIRCEKVNIEIRSVNGDVCAPDTPGEIFVDSPLLCVGYLKSGLLKSATGGGNWFGTSDLGFIDNGGRLFFLGRTKDVISVGGQNLFPVDVERVILECSDIVECCVVEKDDDYFGQIPVAFLVSEIESVDLLGIVRDLVSLKLAPYQHPFHYIWVDELPKLNSGKIDKARLRFHANTQLRNDGRRLINGTKTSDE